MLGWAGPGDGTQTSGGGGEGGGARGVRKGRSRKKLQVLSLSGNQVRGLREDRSSQPRLGQGREAAVGLGLGRTCHSHLQRRLNPNTFALLGCGQCFITRSGWWSSLLNISPVGNSHPNQCSSFQGLAGGVFQEPTKTVALQSSAIDYLEGQELSKFSMRPTCDFMIEFFTLLPPRTCLKRRES